MSIFTTILSLAMAAQQNLCEYRSPPAGSPEPLVEYIQTHGSDSGFFVKATCFCYCTTEENSIYLFQTNASGKIAQGWYFESATDLQAGKTENSILQTNRTPESQNGEGSADKEIFQISGKICKSKSSTVPGIASSSVGPWQELVQYYFDSTTVERLHLQALDAFKKQKPGLAADLLTPKLASFAIRSKIGILNDYGFFLEQANRASEAIPVLEKVVAFDASRTPAYLNLADAFQKSGDAAKAKANYQKYVELMEKSGKGAKVPARVRTALKS